jgi:hypothetical protein
MASAKINESVWHQWRVMAEMKIMAWHISKAKASNKRRNGGIAKRQRKMASESVIENASASKES